MGSIPFECRLLIGSRSCAVIEQAVTAFESIDSGAYASGGEGAMPTMLKSSTITKG